MSPLLAVPLFLASLVVTLTAARLFARRLDRLGIRFGFPEALTGLLTALAADGPEISTALVALVKGAHNVSVGVLVGSNVFNLAAMIGVSALLARAVRLPRDVLVLEGLIATLITLIGAAVLLGWTSPAVALLLMACVLVPYLLLVIHGSPSPGNAPGLGRVVERVARAVAQRTPVERSASPSEHPVRGLVMLIVFDVTLIVAGSIGMVQAALALGDRWRISNAVLGVLVLGPLTSLPNAMTAIRLGLAQRGSALVSETFNSNTINLLAGVTIPALFVGVSAASDLGRVDVAWLIAMTALSIIFLGRPHGVRRVGATTLLALYLAFVIVQVVAA
jgi:cation:H+ antiporter